MKHITYLLEHFDTNELSVLHKLLKTKENNIQEIEEKLGEILLPSGVIGGIAKFVKLSRRSLTYSEFIIKIASNNEISLNFENEKTIEAEQKLFITLFKTEFDKMSESEKEEYFKKLQENGLDKSQIASLTAITTLGVAQASGFGVYLLASSTIATISSALGIVLPFALYTTVSSLISIFTGPVGFLIVGVTFYSTFKKIFIGDYENATKCFKYIASMRNIVPVKYENEINEEKNKVSKYLIQNEKETVEINNNNQQINTSKKEITIHTNKIQELQTEINLLKNKNLHTQSNITKIESKNINLRNDININENAINKSRALIMQIAAKLQSFIMKTKNNE